MKFACISDLHGHLPDLSGLEFDALLIGGDVVPLGVHAAADQVSWLSRTFRPWLERAGRPVFGVAGNHDTVFERQRDAVPDLPWTYLQDSGFAFGGFKIWGTPWQPRFHDWAFNADEPKLRRAWAKIPSKTDVLLLHGPPYGYGDLVRPERRNAGSHSLMLRILEVRPKLAVFGHIHEGYGSYRIGETICVNASHVDLKYRPRNPPVVVEI